jgi:hypothetical protein
MGQSSSGSRGTPTPDANQGEGNRTADRNYREATEKFVNSERGKEQISKAGDVPATEEPKLRKAEEIGKSRAKGN